jgi:hypothetical protein
VMVMTRVSKCPKIGSPEVGMLPERNGIRVDVPRLSHK